MTKPCFTKWGGNPTAPKLSLLLLILLTICLVGLVNVSCGGGETDPTDTSDIKKYDRPIKPGQDNESNPGEGDQAIDNEQVREAMELLKKVSLSPQVIRADTPVTIEVETSKPLEENQYLTYLYYINSQPLEETKEAKLPTQTYKKGNTLFADVMLYENEQLLARRRTNVAMVLNSPPVIDEVVLPEVKGPGTYKFIVKAHDIDNDQMSFSLEMDKINKESEGGEGSEGIAIPSFDIQIDASTGEVTYTMDENLPDSLNFTIAADDGAGGITKKKVTMRFFKRPVTNNRDRE